SWSETLDDRKFYYGVIEQPEEKPTNRRAAMGFMQKWVAVGPMSSISLDTETPYVGQHSPVVTLTGAQEQGMIQHGLAIKSGTDYIGRIVLRADSGSKVTVRLSWGNNQSVSQRISTSTKWKTHH